MRVREPLAPLLDLGGLEPQRRRLRQQRLDVGALRRREGRRHAATSAEAAGASKVTVTVEFPSASTEAAAPGAATAQAAKKKYTNVFPFAQPISYHARLLDRLFSKSRISHLVVLTRTSHPAMYVAARGMGLEVVSLVAGATDHGFKHGEDILIKLFRMAAMAKARKTVVQTGVKRVAFATVPFITVAATASRAAALRPLLAHRWPLLAASLPMVVLGSLIAWAMFLQSGGKFSLGPQLDAGPTLLANGLVTQVLDSVEFDGRPWNDVRYEFTYEGTTLYGGSFVDAGLHVVGDEVQVHSDVPAGG